MKELLRKPLKTLSLILALAAALTACRGAAAAQDGDRYLPAFQDDRMGLYFLDTETIQRQEGGDVFLFRYKSVISWRYRDKLLQRTRDKREREKIRRWAYSIVSLFYRPGDRTARFAVTATFTRTDKLLTRTPCDQPFTPVSRSPAVEALCDTLMRFVAAHPEAVQILPRPAGKVKPTTPLRSKD